jgi:TRAP-type mannitol/chloroaromatic compound transport system permease small subunit
MTAPDSGPQRLHLPHTRYSYAIERVIVALGDFVSWIWLLLLAVIVLNVVMRYLFSEGRIEFEEIQWHLYSIGFLLGMSYGFVSDSHIRVDVLRERLTPAKQAWIELYGSLLLLLPFITLVLISAVPFVAYSFGNSEISEAPGGLPFRWFIKSFLVIGFLLLLIAASARFSRVMCFLFSWPGEKK